MLRGNLNLANHGPAMIVVARGGVIIDDLRFYLGSRQFPFAGSSGRRGSRVLIHSHRHLTFDATTARTAAKRLSAASQWQHSNVGNGR